MRPGASPWKGVFSCDRTSSCSCCAPTLVTTALRRPLPTVSEVIAGENGELVSAGQLADKKGNVVSGDAGWKTRRLAYTIDNHREGYYVVLQFMAPPTSVSEVERVLNLREEVLRHLVVRLEELTEVLPAPEPPPARDKAKESAAPAAAPAPAEAPAPDAAANSEGGDAPAEAPPTDAAANSEGGDAPAEAPPTDAAAKSGAGDAPTEEEAAAAPAPEEDADGRGPRSEVDAGEAAETSPGSEEDPPPASEGPEEAP